MIETEVYRCGLDPQLGFFHQPAYGRPSLMLDVLEEFRPLVDQLVLRLLNRRQLGGGDFERRSGQSHRRRAAGVRTLHTRLTCQTFREVCLYLVVCYDIVEDRRRNRLMRKMRECLSHVQKSVFEGELPDDRLEALRQTVLDEIDPAQDTVRIYHLCARCVPVTEILGTGVYVENGELDEVL